MKFKLTSIKKEMFSTKINNYIELELKDERFSSMKILLKRILDDYSFYKKIINEIVVNMLSLYENKIREQTKTPSSIYSIMNDINFQTGEKYFKSKIEIIIDDMYISAYIDLEPNGYKENDRLNKLIEKVLSNFTSLFQDKEFKTKLIPNFFEETIFPTIKDLIKNAFQIIADESLTDDEVYDILCFNILGTSIVERFSTEGIIVNENSEK